MKKTFKKNQSGFTLIEMLVAVAIFVIVAIVVTGALMVVIQSYRKAQTAKLVIDNLNFVMDQITLDLREGAEYRGFNSGAEGASDSDNFLDGACSSVCSGISFRSRSGTRNSYSFAGSGVGNRIWTGRDCDDSGTCVSSFGMTDPQVEILNPNGGVGFTLRFIPPLDTPDYVGHRKIIISLNGEVVKGAEKTLYHLQSTVSQRNL